MIEDDVIEDDNVYAVSWLHCLFQELENNKVELPMGTYAFVYELLESIRWDLGEYPGRG